jgi:hypothetical protein
MLREDRKDVNFKVEKKNKCPDCGTSDGIHYVHCKYRPGRVTDERVDNVMQSLKGKVNESVR